MKKMNNNNKMRRITALATSILAIGSASAMQSLTDGDLSGVTAQDGITLQLSTPSITMTKVDQCFDSTTGCSTLTGLDASKLTLANVAINKIGMNGAAAAGNFVATATIDADGGSGLGALPGLALTAEWQRGRIKFEQKLINTAGNAQKNMGTFALDSSGRFELIGSGGLFNTTSNKAKLLLRLDDADFFIRNGAGAGAPESVLHDLDFKWDMPQGIVGIDTSGILIRGDVNFNLTFDLHYDANGTSPFQVTAADIPILNYGWTGGLSDAEVRVRGGGSWLNTSLTGSGVNQKYDRSVKTEGLNLSLSWNYEPDFRWVVGEVDAIKLDAIDAPHLEFGSWVNLPNTAQPDWTPATKAFEFPLIAIDMIRAGRGPGGLCWGSDWEGPAASCAAPTHGGQYIDVEPENNSMGILVRDGFLRAYSTDVRIIDPNAPDLANQDRTLGWALVYTMGNIDANIFLRPDERVNKTGIKANVVAMSQTFDVFDRDGDGNKTEQGPNWGYGTHFMIGDTTSGQAIGLINSSFLLAAKNLYINMLPGGISVGDSDLLSSALTDSPVRFAFNGRFGGGRLAKLDNPGASDQFNISDLKINLEFDRFHMLLKPPPSGQTYLGFEATMRFANLNDANFAYVPTGGETDPGSFISLSEPGRPEAAIRFANITGWMAARNGKLQLRPDVAGDDVPAQLVMENDLLIGRSVSNVAGAELTLGRVEMSQLDTGGTYKFNDLGSVVIPGGQWYSRIALQPK
jgi:hypothetical protein